VLKRLILLPTIISATTLTGCVTTAVDYPYNANTVMYYEDCPLYDDPVVIGFKPYYRFDHENQFYFHRTPTKPPRL